MADTKTRAMIYVALDPEILHAELTRDANRRAREIWELGAIPVRIDGTALTALMMGNKGLVECAERRLIRMCDAIYFSTGWDVSAVAREEIERGKPKFTQLSDLKRWLHGPDAQEATTT